MTSRELALVLTLVASIVASVAERWRLPGSVAIALRVIMVVGVLAFIVLVLSA